MTRPERARPGSGALASLPSLAPLPTAAERAAAVIRENIFEGKFQPGTALPEAALSQALQISRNTVREAFRALMSEHLLTYETHKGVAVRALTVADVHDIYTLRQMFETSAIDLLDSGRAELDPAALLEPVAAGEAAGAADDWVTAGTANLRFHSNLVSVHGSTRMEEFFRRLMTEMRLGFLALEDPKTFHAPYLVQNRSIADKIIGGRYDEARTDLTAYLEQAKTEVAAAVAKQSTVDDDR
ncbi:GntR family transcriptional regulator [Rugosimonospora africana]|uniref:GntR family transcriptional regulator n=1 Tax=Rugosimonospora africana TaxID=556532 RepID=A0A8J3QN15_9ACTN|nr:GntR family transcriptional regulator [Rugosimonospora africana]GIH12977.1 GntR family transcriptional regulator [Rugosimonospora africana]